jgi:gliding motility-associated-like protein
LADASTIGGREGRAVLRFQGGTGVLALDWGGSQPGTVLASGRDSLLLGNLPRGTYSPNFIDVNGCRETCSFSIVEPTCNLQARLQPQNPTCAGASNGQIVALLSGGRSPYTFRWSNAGPNKDTLFNLAAGTYQVTVSDAINCQVMLDTVLRDPSALDFRCQVVQQVRTLNGREGRARLIFGGGNAPYNFTVQGPVSSTQTANAAGSFDLNELSVGTYNVTLRDSRGCQQVCSFQISEPTCNLSIQLRSIAPNCQGAANGQVEVLVTGGRAPLQYDWSDNSQDGQATARNLRAGTYSVIVTDSIGCVGLDTVSLREPSALSLVCGSPQTTSTVGGQDGSILLRFSGGTRPYTLVLSGTRRDSFVNIQADSLRVTGLAKGNYRLSLRDANACSAPGCDFSINDPACNLELRLIGVNNPCAGRSIGNILASVNGAVGTLNYDWSDNRFDGRNEASGLRSGVYQLIVTDARLCRDTATYTVTEPSELRVDCQIEAQPTTVGGSEGRILYTVTGGTGVMSTRFSGSSSGVFGDAGGGVYLYSSLRAGTYQFVVTDLNGCTDTCVSTLQAITCNLQGLARTTNPSCHNERNGSISIEVSGNQGAVSYLWAGMIASGQNPRTLPSGTYRVTLTDAARCTDTLSITLSNPPALSLTASAQVQPTPANPNAGTALVNYTGGRPAYTLLYYLEPFTPEGRLFLSATEPGSSTLSNLRAGTYTLVLSDRNGCRDTTSLTLQEPPCTLAVDISSARADCESSHLSTSVSGGTAPFQYNWSPSRFNGQANPRNAAPGQYQLRVVDASGCLALDSITLALDPQALRVQAGALNPACPGDLGAFALRSIAGGQGPFTLSLNAGNPQRFNNPPFTLRNLNPGNYTLRLSNAAGCGFDTSFTISPPRALSLELGADTTLKKGTRYTFAPQVNFRPVRITWAPLEGLSATEGLNAQVQPKFSTAYTLQLRDSAGCEVNDRILITVAGQVEAYFPSAFSPNEDDINDFFSAYANADIERIEVLRIFDRWGGLVFEGKDIPPNEPSQGWDGRSRGQAAPAGVYVYHSVLRLREGSTYQAAGEVILLR